MSDQREFAFISDLMRRHSSMVLEPGKEYLLESRLLPLARTAADGSLSGLVAELKRRPDSGLQELVVDAMTISETSWFRDRLPFDALRDHVLPELARTQAPRELHLWSAGCASGQEVYSLAMVVEDWLREHPTWTASILGTDRSRSLLQRAREGTYSQVEVNRGLPIVALTRHFERDGAQWRVSARIRGMVELRQLNLSENLRRLPPMDVIFLRNVLIYFDVDTKREVLRRVAGVLRPGGLLFLGASETTLHLGVNFERCDVGGAVCYRVSGGASS